MTSRLIRDKPRTLSAALSGQSPRRSRLPWLAGIGLGALALLLGIKTFDRSFTPLAATGLRDAQAAVPASSTCPGSFAPLQRNLSAIARSFDGVVGIGVVKVGCEREVAGERLDRFFPQQSVSKLWVSLAVLDAVDKGQLRLEDPVAIRPSDLTLFHQPLRAEVLEKGRATHSVAWLMHEALTMSDNTANDRLLWTVGGPEKVRATLSGKAIEGIRFGPGERLLQSHVAALRWSQDMALGRNFEQARARVPMDTRKAALSAYVADPLDGARPGELARTLARLAGGELLSPRTTRVMLDILSRTHSGPRRLKAGAPPGWKVYHKTGTGQELAGVSTGYNDVGIIEAPDGSRYAVAVLIAQTRQPIPVRMEMMQSVTRAIAEFHQPGSTAPADAAKGTGPGGAGESGADADVTA